MLKKTVATLVAVMLALALSLATTTAATAAADGRPGGGHRSGDASSSSASGSSGSTPSDSRASTQPGPPSSSPSGPPSSGPAPSSDPAPTTAGRTTAGTQTHYGVALYVYKKVNTAKPASWGNSGPQRLVISVIDNASKATNGWFTNLDPNLLPADVCGSGWAIQQDKATMSASFTAFPDTITPPVVSPTWPPLYDAQHSELSSVVKVPLCAGADASVVLTLATCQAPESIALGSATHASWGTLTRTTGPGAYSVTATADSGYAFSGGATTKKFTGTLAGKLSSDDPACADPARCIPTSSVSYSYDKSTNSGVITVPSPARSTGRLCSPFWVTAASWKYLGTSTWIQKLDTVQKLGKISTPGSYEYSAPVTCGQGDIYASFSADHETLDPTTYLYGPDNPFDEHFLHEMGFSGPKPTYMTTKTGCNEATAVPTTTPPSCEANGQYTLPAVEHVHWWIDGVEVQPGSHTVVAGGSTAVTAVADESWVLTGGTQDSSTHTWSLSWTLEFPEPECESPTTLVAPIATPTPLSCDAEQGGGYTLQALTGVSWLVDGEPVEPGSYPVYAPTTVEVEAVLDQSAGPVAFVDGAQTEWTFVVAAPEECLNLGGSAVTGTCNADSPWIVYDIHLSDPYGQTSGREARLVMTNGTDTVTLDLGTIPASGPSADVLGGRILWPGASVDGDGVANGWPGWELVAGEWQTTTGNYAWTRSITEATLEVNPSMVVALTYPPATPSCVTDPPQDPPTLRVFPTNAQLAERCTSDGRGVLTLGLVDGVSFFEDVNYFIDGVPATSATVSLAPGVYEVTVTTKNRTDGLDGPTLWRVAVTGDDVCGELETLALTGVTPGYLVAFAAMLLALGAAVVATTRTRRAE